MNKRICLNQSVLDFMASKLTRESFVLELGSGWSSRWFADRCGKLTTVETDTAWAETVCGELEGSKCYWELLMPKNQAALTRMLRLDEQPDLILVDCREDYRLTWTVQTWPLLKPGGWLVFDDIQRPQHASARLWLGKHGSNPHALCWLPGDVETARDRLALAWQKPLTR